MNTVNLYNNEGALSTEAQTFLKIKPDNLSLAEWRKAIKEFKQKLSFKDKTEFDKHKKRLDSARWKKKNPKKVNEADKAWRNQNPDKAKKIRTEQRRKYPKKANAHTANWKTRNPEKVKAGNTNYYLTNCEKVKGQSKIYKGKRRKSDSLFRLQESIRVACARVVKQVGLGRKPTSTFKWIGCSAEELKAHIESLFLEGMTWDNYGRHGWHVDRIRPISSFKPEEWEQINHYTNLQPLWAEDNLSKSNKY